MQTVLLDPDTWDLVLDANGNIALASEPYSIAQDVASACRLFIGELWYDTTKGIPYFNQILGERPPISFFKAQIVKAALTVPGVVSAECFINSITARKLTGQIQVVDNRGTTTVVNI